MNPNKRKYGQAKSYGSAMQTRKYVKAYKKGDTKTVQMQKEIQRLKSAMVHNSPPIKTKWYIFSQTPQNEWSGMGLAWPVLGGANNQRLGQDIKLKSLQLKGIVKVSNSDTFDTARLVLVQYLDSNTSGNYPYGSLDNCVKATFLDVNSGDYPYIMPFLTQTKSSYRVLYDKTYQLDNGGNATCDVDVLITSKDLAVTKIHYLDNDDTDVNLPALSEGMIVGFVCSNSTATPNPQFEIVVKLNYIDT